VAQYCCGSTTGPSRLSLKRQQCPASDLAKADGNALEKDIWPHVSTIHNDRNSEQLSVFHAGRGELGCWQRRNDEIWWRLFADSGCKLSSKPLVVNQPSN
jgi:hypothetical protein